jgi:hypothetical protein
MADTMFNGAIHGYEKARVPLRWGAASATVSYLTMITIHYTDFCSKYEIFAPNLYWY